MRMMTMLFFFFLTIRSFTYAGDLYRTGQVTATLKIPVFWVPYVISACCFVVVLVIFGHILQPRKEMIRP
jgi:TRAP-type C4-dicarboxylate transport system permease small subunit